MPFDEVLRLIGGLNYAWSNTESLLIHMIAGLARTDKETATIVFLTLNTARARLDLVERLAKLERVGEAERSAVLALTGRIGRLAGMRNRYNHSIYAFDPESGAARTILMRIADRKDSLKMGQSSDVDAGAVGEMEEAIAALGEVNRGVWRHLAEFGYPL